MTGYAAAGRLSARDLGYDGSSSASVAFAVDTFHFGGEPVSPSLPGAGGRLGHAARGDRDGPGRDNIRVINYQWFGAVHYTASGLGDSAGTFTGTIDNLDYGSFRSRPRWTLGAGPGRPCRCTWASPRRQWPADDGHFITSAVPVPEPQPALLLLAGLVPWAGGCAVASAEPGPREAGLCLTRCPRPLLPASSISPPKAHAAVGCLQIGVAHELLLPGAEEDAEGLRPSGPVRPRPPTAPASPPPSWKLPSSALATRGPLPAPSSAQTPPPPGRADPGQNRRTQPIRPASSARSRAGSAVITSVAVADGSQRQSVSTGRSIPRR